MRQQRRRNDPVTPKQIAMLHVAKSTLQMEEGDYRLLLESYEITGCCWNHTAAWPPPKS